jgi:uncharacterized membrane protein
MMFFGFGFLLVLGLLVWLAVSRSGPLGRLTIATPATGMQTVHQPPAADAAVSIVRERYARGEIDQAEYERLIRELRG